MARNRVESRTATGRRRLVYVHQYFRTPDQSGSSRSWELSRHLADRYDVHLVTASAARHSPRHRDGTQSWQRRTVGPITVHEYDMPYLHDFSHGERLSGYLRFALSASRRAWSLRPDVVYASSTPLTVAIPALVLRWGRRVPMIFEVRDLWPDAPIALGVLDSKPVVLLARLLERVTYRSAAAVVALSPPQGEAASARGARRVEVVPNFSVPALFSRRPFSQRGSGLGPDAGDLPEAVGERPMVFYGGALGLVNGVSWLVDVAAASENRDPVFVVVGAGRDEAAVRQRAARRGVLDRNFFLLPERSKQETVKLLAQAALSCDLIVDEPELWKASPNKVFDSFAAGVPLLLNHGGWLADVVSSSAAGLVAHGMSPAETAEAIADFLSSAERRRTASAASRRLAEQFDADDGCRRIGELVDGALADRTKRRVRGRRQS